MNVGGKRDFVKVFVRVKWRIVYMYRGRKLSAEVGVIVAEVK